MYAQVQTKTTRISNYLYKHITDFLVAVKGLVARLPTWKFFV